MQTLRPTVQELRELAREIEHLNNKAIQILEVKRRCLSLPSNPENIKSRFSFFKRRVK